MFISGALFYLQKYFKILEQARFDGPAGGQSSLKRAKYDSDLETARQDYSSESGSESDAGADRYSLQRCARGVDMKLVSCLSAP